MKRLLFTLILAALLGVAAFKAGVWWLADQRLAEARQALSETGVLARGTIGSSLDGRLVLTGASWQDFELTQPLVVNRVEFATASPVALVTALANPGSLPDRWSLQVEGLALVLEATMFRNWVTADSTSSRKPGALFALPCAPDPRQQLGSGDLLRMGITRLAGDLTLHQTPERLRLDVSSANTGSLELNWPGARLNLLTPEATLESSAQPLEVTLRDGGLMRRLAAYCARETGQETSRWAGRALDHFERALEARGWQASEQLLALYRQWLLEGGEIRARIQPGAEALGMPVRSQDAPANGTMAWALEYNGAKVPDVFLRKTTPTAPETPREALEPVVAVESTDTARWHGEEPAQAAGWNGRRVRVRLSNGNKVEGRLTEATEKELHIARVVAGGQVVYPIPLGAIEKFEVWRRVQPQ